MNVEERPLTADELADLQSFQDAGRQGLGETEPWRSPHEVVEAIGAAVAGLREVEEAVYVPASIAFGALWGEQVRLALGWEWVMLRNAGEEEMFVLVAPDRAYFISALDLFLPYATGVRPDDTSVLLFNMLVAGEASGSKPGWYTELS